MPTFQDSKGEAWTIDFTVGLAKRVKSALKLDLLRPLEGDPPPITRLSVEIETLVDVLYLISKDEADRRQVTDLQFAERLSGEALYGATEAFWEAYTDFFLKLRREAESKAIAKQREILQRAYELAGRKLDGPAVGEAIDLQLGDLESRIDQALTTLGRPSTDSPDS